MPRRPAAFRQADIVRAVRGVVAAGLSPERIEIDPSGRIVIVLKGADAAAGRPNEPDVETAEEERQWAMSVASARRRTEESVRRRRKSAKSS